MTTQKTKKLVYVLNYVHPSDSQHFVHVTGLLRELEKSHSWHIKLISEKGGQGVQTVHGKEVIYLSENGNFVRIFALAITLFKLRRQGYKLIFVRISKPAALVSSIIGKFLGMRTLYWLSSANHDLDRHKPIIRRIVSDFALSSIIFLADRFVTGPETMLRYAKDKFKVPKNMLMLLYNDVDLTRFISLQNRNGNKHLLKILFVHSLSPSKNAAMYFPAIIRLINAMPKSNIRIEIDLVGDGSEREIIEEQVKMAGESLTIRMLGSIPNLELPRYFAASDVFIMPSYREGMPRALMEAMAIGLPAVTTDAGGTCDIVGPRQLEFVVSRDEPETFAQRLVELLNDPKLRQIIGHENRETIKRFSTPVVAKMYDQALSKLI